MNERTAFRTRVFERDGGCLVPWCDREPVDAHHIIERSLWSGGGYFPDNGASVCETHHEYAERNHIPPQAFWMWGDVEPTTPENLPEDVDKWGESFDTPPWEEHRGWVKYPSTGHLPFSPEWEDTRADLREVDDFCEIPLVVTVKMDGGNCYVSRERVAARNGKHAEHESFDYLKQQHAEFAHEIPEYYQIFGEWLYAVHSIKYTDLRSYFQVFAVYDRRYNLWLSWPTVERVAENLGFPTVPVLEYSEDDETPLYDRPEELYSKLPATAETAVENGHEGIVVRSKFPFHYGQFERRIGKYVREGHVQPDDERWDERELTKNELSR